jgi:hypothetical protein
MPISKKPRSKAALRTSTKAGATAALPDQIREWYWDFGPTLAVEKHCGCG